MATSSSSASSASPLASSSQGPLDSARGRASASLGFEAPPAHLALAQYVFAASCLARCTY
jgi:hypothetical protein